MSKISTEFFQSVRIFPTVFVRIFEKVIWEHCFRYNRYFWHCLAPKRTYFSIPVRVKCRAPLALLLGEIKIQARCVFCRKFNFEQLLIKAFFDIIGQC